MVSLRSAKFTPAPEMVIDVETEKDASADSPTSVLNEEVHPSQCSYLAHELIVWYQGQEASMLLPFLYAVVSAIGAIFSATDSVCTLQVLNQDDTPLLSSLVFGEGVVNDAMSVVLFNAIQRFDLTNINSTIALEFAGNCFYLFILSTSLGVAAGLLSAFIMKNPYIGRHSTDREVVHIYAIVCICINVHGLNIYFWLSFIPAILVILVGTKLEHVVSKLALEVKEQQTCTTNWV